MQNSIRLFKFDQKIRQEGYKILAGCDEAGRGPLAGPLVAAVVILPDYLHVDGLDDSKKIKATKREELFEIISRRCLSMGIGIIGEELIDHLNVFQATYFAMKQALKNMGLTPDCLLVDGPYAISKINIEQKKIISGDSKSLSIAAASIIAKVTRDKIMAKIDQRYPCYGFAKNKGYGTKSHMEALVKYGPCSIHRKSFEPVKSLIWENNIYNSAKMGKE